MGTGNKRSAEDVLPAPCEIFTLKPFCWNNQPAEPAFGFRKEPWPRSVATSGDTRKSDYVVQHSKGTDILIHEAIKLHRPDMLDRMRNRTAMKRLGKPEEVASFVVFLASDQASYITGVAIPVAGEAEFFTL